MNEAVSETEFFLAVEYNRPCFLRIRLESLQHIISDLSKFDLHRRPTGSDWSALRGLCPLCTAWTPGETLGMLLVFEQMEEIVTTSYGDISHIRDGRCINDRCASQEIILVWQGDQSIKQQIVSHLERVRADAITKKHESQLNAVERIVSPDILAFTQDTLLGLEARCNDRHLIVGRRFDEFIVWVSVLPSSPNAIKDAFPDGYRSYLDRLLNASGFQAGNIVVTHWISFMEKERRVLNMALLGEKSHIGTDRELVIIPAEML